MCCLHLSYASFHIFSAARSAYGIFSSYKYLFVNFKLVFFFTLVHCLFFIFLNVNIKRRKCINRYLPPV